MPTPFSFMIKRLMDIIWKSDTFFLDLWTSLYSLLLGGMFLFGFIDSYYTGAVYSVLSFYIPREIWGNILILLGLLQLTGLFTDRYSFQKWALTVSTAFWAFTVSVTAFGNGHTSVFFSNCMVLIAYIWLYLRISRRLRIRDEVRAEIEDFL